MFGFGRQLANSSVSVMPLAPKLSEIPAWKCTKSKSTSSEIRNEVGTKKTLQDWKLYNTVEEKTSHKPSKQISKIHLENFRMCEEDNSFVFLEGNDYVTVDLDKEASLGPDYLLKKLASIEDCSISSVITSNINGLGCNFSEIFRESWRILNEGGEICFSGQFSNMRVESVYDANHFILKPIYLEDVRRSLNSNGFVYYQTLIENEIFFQKTSELAENLKLFHKTLNSFKISTMEDCSEDYGQVAIYKGTAQAQPNSFFLNTKTEFPVNHPVRVSGNTAEILLKSRFGQHFDVTQKSNHRGTFK